MAALDQDRQEYTTDEMLDWYADNQSLRLRTVMIGECISFDVGKNTVNVQPLLQRKVNGVVENMPVIGDVPVGFFGAGDLVITCLPKKGDVCILLISDRSLEAWKLKGGITDPGIGRHHHPTDAIAYFGINPFNKAYPSVNPGIDIRTRDGGTSFNVQNGVINMTINNVPVALFGQDGISFGVPIMAPDVSTPSVASLNTHTHGGVQSGGSRTGGPT